MNFLCFFLLSRLIAWVYSSSIDEPFTIIFISDLESNYRGHTVDHAKRAITYLRDLKNKNLYFTGDYKDIKIDPKLIIHGGDNTADNWR